MNARNRKRITTSGRALVAATALGALATGGFYACVFSSSSETNPAAEDDGTGPSGPSSGSGSGTFEKRGLLASLGDKVMLPTYEQFAQAAAALEVAADAYAQSGSDVDRETTQQAWRDAMAIWQRAELMQVGPAGATSATIGGGDLRDQIYSYPLVNRCRVDQELVEGAYANEGVFASELVNVRGLDALEYLLFYEGTTNACAPQNDINNTGSWNGIVADLPERRADYAASIASILRGHADALVAAWKDGFLDELSSAGADSSLFDSDQAGLNAVSDALFYLDKLTKDAKVAVPAGVMDCPAETCPEALELPLAAYSTEAVVENLEGFRMVITGGPRGETSNLGFDDWLIAVGDPALALDLIDRIDVAVGAAEAIENDSLVDALADAADRERVVALFHAIKAVTDLLKADFITVLDLELPKSAEGDND